MNDLMRGLKQFLLEGVQATQMCAEYEQILAGTDLQANNPQVKNLIRKYKQVSGIYFWLMRLDRDEYKIYIGKTTCLSSRIRNYISEFQPHSPNDYKIRIFYEFVVGSVPEATLDLFFSDKTAELLQLSEKEKNAKLVRAENADVHTYSPLLNELPKLTPQAKDELKQVFSRYYRSAVERKLRPDE